MREKLIAITIDYETWNPLPPGETVDWDADVFRPAEQLMKLGERSGAPITFFVEMGEYFWLEQHDLAVARRMETQLQDAARRGHDIQLHLHPNWLPESGARFENGAWYWDPALQVLGLYPGNVTALIARCARKLEEIVAPVHSGYRVTCFRCGGYSAQPFDRVYDALHENGIFCDSSVYAGGADQSRGYDFTSAYSDQQPYFADRFDPQLRAPAAETAILELPIFAPERGRRWCLDGTGAQSLDEQLLSSHERVPQANAPAWLKGAQWLSETFSWPPRVQRVLERDLRRRIYRSIDEHALPSDYFVMIGHTKSELHLPTIQRAAGRLKDAGYRFASLDALAHRAQSELSALRRVPALCKLPITRDPASRDNFADRIPLDRERILLMRAAADVQPSPVSRLRPWASVTELDRVEPSEGAAPWPVSPGSFDCVHVPHLLRAHPDPDHILNEAWSALDEGGLFLCILPPARRPTVLFPSISAAEVPALVARMRRAGFVDISVHELPDQNEFYFPVERRTRRRLRDALTDALRKRLNRSTPNHRLLAAWKRREPLQSFGRVLEAMDWVYHALAPAFPGAVGLDPYALIRGGKGLCIDYCIVLGAILRNEGFDHDWVTMAAHRHPRGRGPLSRDTHEVLQLRLDGCTVILDPMTNAWHPASLVDLLRNPRLAAGRHPADSRYSECGYSFYDTVEWYARVVEYKIRRDIGLQHWLVPWRENPNTPCLRQETAGIKSEKAV